MRKIISIMLGWWFWITNRNNELARERLQHCAYCKYRRGVVCSCCGCVLQAKARIKEEECPKDFWPNYYTWFRQQLEEYNKK